MHPAVEEVKIDPFDFFIDVGSLVLEGRVPGLSSRGYGEGIHCPPAQLGQVRHQCNVSTLECQKFEVVLKHMALLWKNNIPMCVEVLLSPECRHCRAADMASVDISSAPDTSHLLLEQWFIHMVPRRVPDPTIAPRSLIQAMRSYLHFSQISAWYSLSGGRSPRSIYYRISVPGEAFSSKFHCIPHLHTFPVASLGRNASIKVSVKSIPRSPGSSAPTVPCAKHSLPRNMPGNPAAPNESTTPCIRRRNNTRKIGDVTSENDDDTTILEQKDDTERRKAKKKHSRGDTDSPDLLLGESLLDPPQSLQMYPRRYQSPSRCGSPSVEVPEHLMFGPRTQLQFPSEPSSGSCSSSVVEEASSRGRPQRRPVIERFLKKSGEVVQQSDLSGRSEPSTSSKLPKEERRESKGPISQQPSAQVQQQLLFRRNDCGSTGNGVATREVGSRGHGYRTNLEKCFDDLNLCKLNQESSEHRLPGPIAPVCELSLSSSECDLKRTTPARVEVNEVKDVKSGPTGGHPVVVDEASVSSGGKGGGPIDKTLVDGSHRKAMGHSRTWSEGLCDLKLKDGVVGKGSQIFSNLIQKHKARQLMCKGGSQPVPTAAERAQFRRSLDSATSMVFHQKTGLPLTSSPAPLRKSGASFDFDSSLTSVSAIKRALFEKNSEEEDPSTEEILSSSAPASTTTSSLIVNFEESVLNGRLEPVSTVQGFVAEIGASGSFCPRHITLPVTVFFYSLQDIDKVVSPYLGHINLGMKGYHVPKTGTIQLTLFNPHRTVVKMFVVRYDLSDMPPNCQTFIRQRTLYMPTDGSETDAEASRWLRYLIHLRFASSKSGRIYLHTDVRIIVFRKSDLDAATIHGDHPYELRSFTQCPVNPKFSPCK
ncbi:unnamed protein product [Ixodes hexagonus]